MRAIGLEGTSRVRRVYMARTTAKVIELLKVGKVATAANDNGALNVWRDRHGKYRCEAYRRCITQDSQVFTCLTHVRSWCSEWFKKIA